MTTFNRRRLLQLAGLGAAGAGLPGRAFADLRPDAIEAAAATTDRTVRLSGDGVGMTPAQYAALLVRLLDEQAITPDS